MPLIGLPTFNMPVISEAEYIELVNFSGRELHPGNRGKITAREPRALTKLGLDKTTGVVVLRTSAQVNGAWLAKWKN